jgi:hypothetical protein
LESGKTIAGNVGSGQQALITTSNAKARTVLNHAGFFLATKWANQLDPHLSVNFYILINTPQRRFIDAIFPVVLLPSDFRRKYYF